jgi:hypothetical protein
MKLELDQLYWIKYKSITSQYVGLENRVDIPSVSSDLYLVSDYYNDERKYKVFVMAWDCETYIKDEDIIDFVKVTNPFEEIK